FHKVRKPLPFLGDLEELRAELRRADVPRKITQIFSATPVFLRFREPWLHPSAPSSRRAPQRQCHRFCSALSAKRWAPNSYVSWPSDSISYARSAEWSQLFAHQRNKAYRSELVSCGDTRERKRRSSRQGDAVRERRRGRYAVRGEVVG